MRPYPTADRPGGHASSGPGFTAHLSTSAILRPRPYRKTAKSSANEITREMPSYALTFFLLAPMNEITREIPSRSMMAKEVRSTREKSWSGKRSPMAHAASRSALIVCSMVAIPLRRPPQNASAAWAEMKWWMRRHVSSNTWSLVTSGSSVVTSRLAESFCRSPRSAAAYQAELSTKMLMAHRDGGAFRHWPLPRSCDLFLMRYRCLPTCRDRRRWNGRRFVRALPSPGQRVGVCIQQVKHHTGPHVHEFVCAIPS